MYQSIAPLIRLHEYYVPTACMLKLLRKQFHEYGYFHEQQYLTTIIIQEIDTHCHHFKARKVPHYYVYTSPVADKYVNPSALLDLAN